MVSLIKETGLTTLWVQMIPSRLEARVSAAPHEKRQGQEGVQSKSLYNSDGLLTSSAEFPGKVRICVRGRPEERPCSRRGIVLCVE